MQSDTMKRVCYTDFDGVRLAGSQQSLLNLIVALKKYNVEAYLVDRSRSELLEKGAELGLNTYVFTPKRLMTTKGKNASRAKMRYPAKAAYNRLLLPKIEEFLVSNKIELVHLSTSMAPEIWAEAARRANIPYVWHIREFLDDDHDMMFLNQKHTYKLIREADAIIAISKSVQSCWEKRLGCPVSLVYNGLPKDEYYLPMREGISGQELRCLMVGRIMESKGQFDAVKAIEILKRRGYRVKLTLVGYRGINDYEKNIKEYIKTHGLEDNIELVEYTYDMSSIRRGNDLGLTCSRAEAFGRVTIEYMLSGLAVIGSNTGGTPELIDDGKTGYLYRYGDEADLAEKIAYAYDHRDEMYEVAKRGQESALTKFTIERTACEVNKIYDTVLARRGGYYLNSNILEKYIFNLQTGGVAA